MTSTENKTRIVLQHLFNGGEFMGLKLVDNHIVKEMENLTTDELCYIGVDLTLTGFIKQCAALSEEDVVGMAFQNAKRKMKP